MTARLNGGVHASWLMRKPPPRTHTRNVLVLLEGVEGRDPFERLVRDPRGAADGEFIKPAAHMRPSAAAIAPFGPWFTRSIENGAYTVWNSASSWLMP